jgi:GNAT superfamily N-acetyltransferase
MTGLRFRQIHMDFHTSEHIPGVGSAFDPDVFADTLARAHVDSVTCFARCHHGWIYYDTAVHPERRHPQLERDLLREQIEACHARGIRVPIYTTVQWDHFTARMHPEWRVITPEGRLEGTPPFEPGFYRKLCLNSPYADLLKTHTRDIQDTLPVDGFFFDIVQTTPCVCRWCLDGMAGHGLDPEGPAAREAYAVGTLERFRTGMSAFVRQVTPDASIFYNAGHIGPAVRPVADAYTHFELEVERKEPWCAGARPVSEIAVLSPEEFQGGGHSLAPALRGVTQLLEELGHQFDIVDSAGDLSGFSVVILPDHIPVSAALRDSLEAHVAGRGGILASFASGLDAQSRDFAVGALGVRRADDGPLPVYADTRHEHCDYLLPRGAIGEGLPETEHAMYLRGLAVAPAEGAEVLGERVEPYFDRTWEHFCSHLQTPSSGRAGTPAIVRGEGSIYFAHPVFTQYDTSAPRWCKTLVANALKLLLPDPLVTHDGPSTLRVSVTEQPDPKRWVVHLLHYIPERRGRLFDTVEDVIPLHDLTVSVRTPAEVRAVTRGPDGDEVAHETRDGRVEVRIPRLDGHGLIALEL